MINYLWENLFRKQAAAKTVDSVLQENFLFETLSKKELRFVSHVIHLRTFKQSEPVFRQGDLGVGMYIIYSGSVDIFVENPSSSVEKQMNFVTKLQTGDFFGELSLVEDSSRRTATAIACEETVLIGFFKPDLIDIIERQPATGVKILLRLSETLGRRLKETTVKVTELKKEIQKMMEPHT